MNALRGGGGRAGAGELTDSACECAINLFIVACGVTTLSVNATMNELSKPVPETAEEDAGASGLAPQQPMLKRKGI